MRTVLLLVRIFLYCAWRDFCYKAYGMDLKVGILSL